MEYLIAFLIAVTGIQAFMFWRIHDIHTRVWDNERYLNHLWEQHDLK
jgi:hypothetical protein